MEFVGEQWPALGKIDAGATVQALAEAKPDAIFNVTFGADLTNFVRQGNTRGLFENRAVVSLLTGEPEYLGPLGDETPEGWIVTGYPVDAARHAGEQGVRRGLPGALQGDAADGFGGRLRADQLDRRRASRNRAASATEQMVEGFAGAAFDTPFGRALVPRASTIRARWARSSASSR